MKPSSVQLSGDGSPAEEPKRTVGEKLREASEVAITAIAKYRANWEGRSLPISKEIERRKWSYRAEDPIRILMFLGAWSHT
ncbi:hypothetical protein I3843_07G103400 [Carya illinoinensis]|uniref:Uncharacterized protein n=1 Tax=Carya illinoinensis TaxID=32201 RepID=A0A8T1Q3U1_CARIL|nr:hypothetical protein I3760_07G104200 [Carya illinoinensis]KAG6647832.1 hypothetical protein CIPAW_07G105700 [Carya illinoinensis]KAG7970811.1 hypothetical protein I3843_07G103400 [Carya illinoinensis]